MAYKVLIVDDQIVARQLFSSIIATTDRYEIVEMIDTARIADSYCARGGIDLFHRHGKDPSGRQRAGLLIKKKGSV